MFISKKKFERKIEEAVIEESRRNYDRRAMDEQYRDIADLRCRVAILERYISKRDNLKTLEDLAHDERGKITPVDPVAF